MFGYRGQLFLHRGQLFSLASLGFNWPQRTSFFSARKQNRSIEVDRKSATENCKQHNLPQAKQGSTKTERKRDREERIKRKEGKSERERREERKTERTKNESAKFRETRYNKFSILALSMQDHVLILRVVSQKLIFFIERVVGIPRGFLYNFLKGGDL